MRRVFPRLTLGILASALLWSLLPLPGAGAEPDLRVIVTSIDGIRNSEGFGDPDCQDGVGNPPPPAEPTCLIPKLEALFRAPPSDGGTLLGTLYTGATAEIPTTEGSAFVNNAATWTTPGHTMLLTGVRDVEPNRGPVDGPQLDIRPLRPTVFERLRKQLGWADDAAAVVSKTTWGGWTTAPTPPMARLTGPSCIPPWPATLTAARIGRWPTGACA